MKNWLHDPIYFAPIAKLGGGWIAFKDSSSPPAAPDYTGAAQAQGAANVETARAQGRMNNPNVITPYGTQTVQWGQSPSGNYQWNGSTYADEGAIRGALGQYASANGYNPASVDQWLQSPDQYGISRGSGGTDQPTVTQTFSPDQQRLYDSQNRISQNLAGVAESGLNRVSQGFDQSFDTAGLPQQASGVAMGNYQTNVSGNTPQQSYAAGGNIQSDTGFNQGINQGFDAGSGARNSTGYNQPVQGQIANAGQQQNTFSSGGPVQQGFNTAGQQQTGFNQGGQVQGGLDFSGAPALPGTNDFSADRDAVTNALLARSEPQFQRDEEATRTRLMNQGLAAGSEASNYDLDTLNRARNDARNQAILAGSQEQSRLFGLASQARNQYTGERAQQGNFANAAQGQQFSQGLASGNFANNAQATQYGQNLGAMQANNAAQAQQFGQNQALGNFANTAQQNQFSQNQAAGQFANAAQGQGYAQAQGDLAAYNAAQAQNYSQNRGAAEFGNQAQAQGYTQAQGDAALNNAAQAQANQQNQQAAQFGNQAIAQQFSQDQQNAALNNTVQQQNFTQGLANANLTNQARQQGIQEQAYLRSLPLNELNSLRTGAQVTNPQFQSYQGVNIEQTPVFQGAQAQGQANQNLYNVQQGAANSFNSGLMSMAGTAAGSFFGPVGAAAGGALGRYFGGQP